MASCSRRCTPARYQTQDIHYPRPRVVSIAQTTETGTVYRPGEVAALSAVAREHGLRLHMDGARFANAVAALGLAPADVTWRAGVDVLCFGGTKMGLPVGEAVVFFDRGLSEEFAWRCKQAGQLASKMRFLSAPGWACCATMCGCVTQPTPTAWPRASPKAFVRCRA